MFLPLGFVTLALDGLSAAWFAAICLALAALPLFWRRELARSRRDERLPLVTMRTACLSCAAIVLAIALAVEAAPGLFR